MHSSCYHVCALARRGKLCNCSRAILDTACRYPTHTRMPYSRLDSFLRDHYLQNPLESRPFSSPRHTQTMRTSRAEGLGRIRDDPGPKRCREGPETAQGPLWKSRRPSRHLSPCFHPERVCFYLTYTLGFCLRSILRKTPHLLMSPQTSLLYVRMKTLKLEWAYPSDSPKIMWRDSDRAATDQTQGSPSQAGRSLSLLPLPEGEQRLEAKGLANRSRKSVST